MTNRNKVLTLILVCLVLVGAACQKKSPAQTVTSNNSRRSTTNVSTDVNTTTNTSTAGSVTWMQNADGWQAEGTPPPCPSPMLKTPTSLATVTSILYPGQTRGGNYKPHGGFRFDTAGDNFVTVTAAMDAEVVRGARYLVNGEAQYTFDFMAPCGVMYRLGHLLVLTSKFQAMADTFPPALENDSRTTNVNPRVAVTAGEQIAAAVGVTKGGVNVFFDFGVYDFKAKNAASMNPANPAYAATHDAELAQHALCWFDLLPAADAAKVKSLPPGDSTASTTSDYCS